MTEAEARGFLESLNRDRAKLLKVADEIDEIRSVATNCVASTDKDCVQSSGSADKMINLVSRVVELERKSENLLDRFKSKVALTKSVIEDVDNERMKKYLTIRFVYGNNFYDTSLKMKISTSTARRVDNESISAFVKRYNSTFNG